MKKLLLTVLAGYVGALMFMSSGCSVAPASPAQAVFEAKQHYAVALTAAVAYKKLPDCAIARQPCSDKAIVAQLQKADTVASTALDAAESAVRMSWVGANVTTSAIAAANSALAAFVSITSQLGK